MKNTLLGKPEKIFLLSTLAIVYILCLVKFFISFSNFSTVANLMEMDSEIYLSYGKMMSTISTTKIVSIVSVCCSIIGLLLPFSFLLIKNTQIRKNLFIACITISSLIILFFFVCRFTVGDLYTFKNFSDDSYYYSYSAYDFLYSFMFNLIYLLISSVLSVVISYISLSLSNDIFGEKQEAKNEIKSTEEQYLSVEIEKLKSQVRIKNLEKEYLNLKSQLEEPQPEQPIKNTKKKTPKA